MSQLHSFSKTSTRRLSLALAISAALTALPTQALPSFLYKHKPWQNCALTDDQQKVLENAGRAMHQGNYAKAQKLCQEVLDNSTDVSKCLAIATYTEQVGLPMVEMRRACLNKAVSLAQSNDDMILVALKARSYEFYEVTRQCVQSLLTNARTIPELYDLARKAQEVALNDISHMAMEKAYTGIKDDKQVWDYIGQCKLLGMEDLLRKTIKDLIDDQQDVTAMCDILLKTKSYNMRDMNRYGLRRAMDDAKTVDEMEAIFEVARQLNEYDIANRANYYVRKGKLIQQIKHDRANYEAQLRAWREGIDIDSARAQDPTLNPPSSKKGGDTGPGF